MSRLRVLLVDDNIDFLDGVAAWFAGQPGAEVVGTAESGRQAVAEVDRLQPDLVLMDVTMPDMNGFEATRWIKSTPRSPLVVLMTFHDSDAARSEARTMGADGFVSKARFTEQLVSVVEELTPATPRETASARTDKEVSWFEKEEPPRDLSS